VLALFQYSILMLEKLWFLVGIIVALEKLYVLKIRKIKYEIISKFIYH